MIDFTQRAEPSKELEPVAPAGEFEAALPAIEPGLQVLMRTYSIGRIWTVEKVDKTVDLSSALDSYGRSIKFKKFWEYCEPLGPIRKALDLQPAVGVGLRVRRRGSIDEGTVLSVTATHAKVKGFYSEHLLEDFWKIFELIEDLRIQASDRGKLPRLLEIAGELDQIAKLIEELSLGYGPTDENKISAYSSQVFQTLADRRDELRRELVALG